MKEPAEVRQVVLIRSEMDDDIDFVQGGPKRRGVLDAAVDALNVRRKVRRPRGSCVHGW
jgi:hypothetical protein